MKKLNVQAIKDTALKIIKLIPDNVINSIYDTVLKTIIKKVRGVKK
jgi:hypothetical protein